MSGPEQLPPDDHELEEFLAGRGPHRARYRTASREQAPTALDAVVLAQARAAVAAAPTLRTPPRGLSRWRLPLSLAATLVLGVGLSTRVLRETPVLPAVPAPVEAKAEASMPMASEAAAVDAVDVPSAAATVADSVAPESAAKARHAESRSAPAAEPERMDRAFAKAEPPVQPISPDDASAERMAAAPAPLPPPPPPAPAMAMKQAPAAQAFAPSGSHRMTMSDSVASAASPVETMSVPGPRSEFQGKRLAAASTLALEPLAGRYRTDSGAELELMADGRFTLSLLPAQPVVATVGGRLQREAGGERLRPDTEAELPCALWLQASAPGASDDTVQLRADCASHYAGVYRREVAEP